MSISIYETIELLKEDKYKSIYLVRSKMDHLLYIKRVFKNYKLDVYHNLKTLALPHTPKIIEVEETKEECIIIEQFLNYETLESAIKNYELSNKDIPHIMTQLFDTLEILHEHSIVHRDIKPDNIFFDGKNIYLFDFDISRIHQKEQVKDTDLLGSYGYAAPEQFGFGQSDARTDIYALGILLNVLLNKSFPQEEIYSGPETDVILKATHIDPKQRYQTIAEMRSHFLRVQKASWTLPGFRQGRKENKAIALCGYAIIIVLTFATEFENSPNHSITTFCFRLLVFTMLLTIVLFASNYKNIWEQCLWNHSKNEYLRILGRIITAFLVIFALFLITAMLAGIFNQLAYVCVL